MLHRGRLLPNKERRVKGALEFALGTQLSQVKLYHASRKPYEV